MSEAQLSEFEEAIVIACHHRSAKPLEEEEIEESYPQDFETPRYFQNSHGELVVSVDANWVPFLDNTKGYNRGAKRWYLPGGGDIEMMLAEALSRSPTTGWRSGGRLFVSGFGAFRREGSGNEEDEAVLPWVAPRTTYLWRLHPDSSTWPPPGM
jgi:hypothetical protein